MLNKKLFLFCLTLIVLIILINVSGSISKFGNDNVVNITIASSDIAKTTFSLQKYTKCYFNTDIGTLCNDYSTYSANNSNQIPIDYQNNLESYYENYLTNNLFNNVSINVLHCNLKNTLYDYQGQTLAEDYITGLGSISCTKSVCSHSGYDECEKVTITVTPGSIPPQQITLQDQDLFIVTLDRYINYGIYNNPTVYQYVDDGIRDGNCPSSHLVTDCGQGNIINNKICGGCDFNLVVNGIIPDIEIPTVKVYNGVTFSIGSEVVSTDFIDNKGNPCYLIPNLFRNNATITIPLLTNIGFKDFMIKVRPLIGTNSYVTRIDYIPGSFLIVLYWTTLDDNYSYVSDSVTMIDYSNIQKNFTPYTHIDKNNRFSDQHLFITGDNASYIALSGTVGLDSSIFETIGTAGNGIDYIFLVIIKMLFYDFSFPPAISIWCGNTWNDITKYVDFLRAIKLSKNGVVCPDTQIDLFDWNGTSLFSLNCYSC